MPQHDKIRMAQVRAQRLRKAMTPSELVLWEALRGRRLGVRFRRQEPIGPYIVDFACRDAKLIVEADGDHHCNPGADGVRDDYLRSHGYRVLRFWNKDIAQSRDWVVDEIKAALEG